MESLRPSHTPSTTWTHSLTTSAEPSSLTSKSRITPLISGSGESIYSSAILPVLMTAEKEILLVTCFWASSLTLSALSELLINLSEVSLARSSVHGKLRVRIGFSSRSLVQKLFHTSSPTGHIYPPSTWVSKLGLPPPEKLEGLDLQIKSIFYLPFSVLHPKFIIIDRLHAILPSCNISWESWLECSIHLSGPIVEFLLSFWRETWGRNDFPALLPSAPDLPLPAPSFPSWHQTESITTLLPSPHHRNPHFYPWPLTEPPPPQTPLNAYLLQLFAEAKEEIYIVTPNLTSPPVLSALLAALTRGVNVKAITNRRMMVLEQLLTAGTITEICVRHLKRRYEKLLRQASQNHRYSQAEEGRKIGKLSMGYFKHVPERGPEVKCHIKCTIVDARVVVLGSGNMDRASWYTSQELGVAVESMEVVAQVRKELDVALEGRVEMWYEAG